MDVTSATSAAPTTSAAANDQKQLTSNFNTFLTLLTAQLQNQDPLSPMDSAEFTQQLVQFSSVEQAINTNQNLESLISLTKVQGGAQAVGFIGKKLTLSDGSASLQNGAADWTYSLASAAAAARLVVTDAQNRVVYSADAATGAGDHSFSWNGENNFGQKEPDGSYTLTVTAKAQDGSAVGTRIASEGIIDGVDLSGSEPELLIGSMSVPLSKAAHLTN